MEYKDIVKAQQGLKTLPVKGKEYVMVHERVKAFRKLYPEGSIETNIEHLEEGMIICKTIVRNEEGRILATGLAYEREESSMVNRTSFIENCQTSSVGRAMALLGIGIDVSIASAEEMERATAYEPIGATKAKALEARCKRMNINIKALMEQYKVENLEDLTEGQHSNINLKLNQAEGKK